MIIKAVEIRSFKDLEKFKKFEIIFFNPETDGKRQTPVLDLIHRLCSRCMMPDGWLLNFQW